MDRFDNNFINVSGLELFANSHWRNAITFYLAGVWGDKRDVMYRPKLSFDRFSLCLNPGNGRYWAHTNEPEDPTPLPFFSDVDTIKVGDDQLEVERALMLFVNNDRIKMLVIEFSETRFVRLWKGKQRGELYCCSYGLSSMEDAVRGR